MASSRRPSFVFVLFMALGMSAAMSLAMSLYNLGLDHWTFYRWFKSFLIAFIVAVPVALLWAPVAHRLTDAVSR